MVVPAANFISEDTEVGHLWDVAIIGNCLFRE